MQFDYGEISTELPVGFVPRQQWPEYDLVADTPNNLHPLAVGTSPMGQRWGIWPLYFEEYISDVEPDLTLSQATGTPPYRVLLWQRIIRTDVPPGWYALSRKPTRTEGFAELHGNDYYTRWSESAQRARKKWHKECTDQGYRIEQITFPVFEAAYLKSTIAKKADRLWLNVIARKLARQHYPGTLDLWGVVDSSGAVVAGLATLTSPTYKASFYVCGFYHEATREQPLMVGLMDHWFTQGVQGGLRFLHFGSFWQKGEPRAWKGYSRFKAKFGLRYIAYPPSLLRLGRKKSL